MTLTKQQLAKAARSAMAAYRTAGKPYAWVVEVLHPHGHYVFETRREARIFAKAQTAGTAFVFKAHWGKR